MAGYGLPEYDAIRQRLKGQFTQKRQETQDAIQRRFASNGMVGSGAYGKSAEEADRTVSRDELDATAQIDFAEAGESQRRKEIGEGRAYQTGEREASQKYLTGERQATQGFQTGERESSQKYTTGERVSAQLFNKELFDRDMLFKERTRDLDNAFRLKEFDESKRANEINAIAAFSESGINQDDLSKYNDYLAQLRGGNVRKPEPPAPRRYSPIPGFY